MLHTTAENLEDWGWTSLGDVSRFRDRDEANRRVTWQLDRFTEVGFGRDIRLDGWEIGPVSEHLVMCRLTWRISPSNGMPSWSWTNVYAPREAADASRYFEAAFADNEIAELLKRFPDAYTT